MRVNVHCTTLGDMKKDVQISIRIPSEVRDALRKLALKDKRPLSSYISLVLEEHTSTKKKERS